MKYDRIWELHLTADDGFYDLPRQIDASGSYQRRQQTFADGVFLNMVFQTRKPRIVETRNLCASLPHRGVVASTVTCGSLRDANADQISTALVNWVSNQELKGKIRFTGHGSTTGQVSMPRDGPGIDATRLVPWLEANGLSSWDNFWRNIGKPTGLLTVHLSVCKGGLDASSVDKVVEAFNNDCHRGIKVTGSRESLDRVMFLTEYVAALLPEVIRELGLLSVSTLRAFAKDCHLNLKIFGLPDLNAVRRSRGEHPVLDAPPKFESMTPINLVTICAEMMLVERYRNQYSNLTPGMVAVNNGQFMEKLNRSDAKVSKTTAGY